MTPSVEASTMEPLTFMHLFATCAITAFYLMVFFGLLNKYGVSFGIILQMPGAIALAREWWTMFKRSEA